MRLTRRRFVSASALAATGIACGGAGAAPAQPALRWAIIGTGSRCRHHIAALKGTPGMEIVAACDVDEGRLAQGLQRIGKAVPTCREYRKLLAMPDVDAVLVTTPNLLHEEMVVASVRAGKHVLCEKPMATTLKGCLAMKQAAAETGKVVLYGLQLHYSNRYGDLKKLVDSGRIGAPRFLSLLEYRGDWNNNNVWQYTDPSTRKTMNWRYSQAASGGTLNEKDCHYFDLFNWLVGATPTRIECSGGLNVYKDRETWDHANVMLEYPGGVRALHGLCMYGPHRLDFQLIGDEGSLTMAEDHVLFQKRGARTAEKIPLTPEVGHGDRGPMQGVETAVTRLYTDLAECLRTKKQPFVTADQAIASSKMAFLAERAAALGRAVGWDEPV